NCDLAGVVPMVPLVEAKRGCVPADTPTLKSV
ncbi:hypothetical protein A2U01_0079462, partial [Trifolium medium]|nr:hypothetical protein [Trifolium medium]